MAIDARVVYDGKAEGIYHPDAFDKFMSSKLPEQIGGGQITIRVTKYVRGPITTYTLFPLNINVPYECIDGQAVVGVVGENAHNLEKVAQALLEASK